MTAQIILLLLANLEGAHQQNNYNHNLSFVMSKYALNSFKDNSGDVHSLTYM